MSTTTVYANVQEDEVGDGRRSSPASRTPSEDGEITFDQDGRRCDRIDELIRKYVDTDRVHNKMKVMVIEMDDGVSSVEVSPRCASSRVNRADDVETKRTTQMSA